MFYKSPVILSAMTAQHVVSNPICARQSLAHIFDPSVGRKFTLSNAEIWQNLQVYCTFVADFRSWVSCISSDWCDRLAADITICVDALGAHLPQVNFKSPRLSTFTGPARVLVASESSWTFVSCSDCTAITGVASMMLIHSSVIKMYFSWS